MAGALLLRDASDTRGDLFAVSGFTAGDPFVWIEIGERRILLVGAFEVVRARRESRATEVWSTDECGLSDLLASGLRAPRLGYELTRVALARTGAESVVVADWQDVGLVDYLRSSGVAVEVGVDPIGPRRRSKDARAIASVRAAVEVTDDSLALIRDRLGAAVVDGGGELVLDGAPLTSERLHAEVRSLWIARGCEGETPIIAGGAQGADPHELGHGVLRAGEPIVCDLFPRHSQLRMYADLTRTFCVGEPPADIQRWHGAVAGVLGEIVAAIRPGVSSRGLHELMCERFRDAGYGSDLYDVAGAEARCPHGMGHGVGLDIHESPWCTRGGAEELVAGDVVTVEPGLYRDGYGGVRLEHTVLVTADGAEVLDRFPLDVVV